MLLGNKTDLEEKREVKFEEAITSTKCPYGR